MKVVLLYLLWPLAALAATTTNLTTTGCVDASGLQKCLDNVASTAQTCLDNARKAGSQAETIACGCVYYTDNVNCYAASCWNRVYECEYQKYVYEYLKNCETAKLPLPYFPAPDNAPDACSCNLGKVYQTFLNSLNEGTSCIKGSSSFGARDALGSINKMVACECCAMSGALSGIYETCPDTDPDLVGLSYVSQLETLYNQPFSACGSYMSSYDCQKDLSFTAASSFISPGSAFTTGKGSLSNGAGSVTSPGSGSVFSYTNLADSVVYTITAASSSGNHNSGGSGSSSGSAQASATGSKSSDEKGAATIGISGACKSAMLVVLTFLVAFL
ncbi:unnamed protein product [Clonostachys rosea f. rosea IK726]|uniref:Uncharacterized protein n=1 Tax=Clonostachys rosea f. rosea IK726 TaxID=1349383 RepID=A0ACA9TFI1_BIOOC|nr:unnamed protein product [Clonostachys rosea f. rosea IK726]